MENKLAIEVAKNLLKIKAVFLKPNDPFTWASGIKSPIYCDNRLTLSYPETRKVVEQGLAEIIKKYYPTCEVIMGTSTAGIAHAAYVSDILDMPMGYVRGGAKDHGRGNQIEGVVPVGKDVVVIEDLISTAGSSIEVVDVLREAMTETLKAEKMKKAITSLCEGTNLKANRKIRIAKGAGLQASDVNRVINQHEKMKEMMKQMKGMMKHGKHPFGF